MISRHHFLLGLQDTGPQQEIGGRRVGREVAGELGPVRRGIESEGEARDAGRSGERGGERHRAAQGEPARHHEGNSEEPGEGKAHVDGRAEHETEEVLADRRHGGWLGPEGVRQQGSEVGPTREGDRGETEGAGAGRPCRGTDG